jgi:hypothetical protein
MTPTRRTKIAWLALLASTMPSLVLAQERPKPVELGRDEAEKELIQLFGKVEKNLREIDRLLSDAGAGDTSALQKIGSSGIDELLKKSQQSGKDTAKDIDRLLELAKQLGTPQSGAGSGQPQPQPGDPGGQGLIDKKGQQSAGREETPSAPESKGEQPKPGQNGKPPGQKPENQPDPSGKDPKSPLASKDEAKNRAASAPQVGAKDPAARPSDDRDRWGDLPVHARDVFRNEGGADMPVQYRDWIDAYYRRLNKKP